MADNQTITHHEATEAAGVLECYVQRLHFPANLDRDAVERVRLVLLRAILAPGETTSIVIVSGQGERA